MSLTDGRVVIKKLSFPRLDEAKGRGVSSLTKESFIGDGELSEGEQGVSLSCIRDQGAFQLRFAVGRRFYSNGIGVRFKVTNWNDLSYVAVGFTQDGKFVHVKIPHVVQGEWLSFSFSFNDLVFLMQNQWVQASPCLISDCRVFVKGKPAVGGGRIAVSEVGFWLESEDSASQLLADTRAVDDLIDVVSGYWRACFKTYADQADEFLDKGFFPAYGDINLAWDPLSSEPRDIKSINTYRFSWHALHAVSMCLLRFEDTGNVSFVYCARDFVNLWLEKSFFCVDADQKYAWYDHGAAERTIVLLVIHQLGLRFGFDFRFKSRVAYALLKHTQLLYSEAFYASHQIERYHNHAWFQDIALIAAAICQQHADMSSAWLDKGLARLNDQLAHLIHRESGYAVFVENSIGYHQGVQRLVGFAGQLESLAGHGNHISTVANELDAWSQDFRYPDERSPAQGDTFRKANPNADHERVQPTNWEKQTLRMPAAGYGVVKGGDSCCPWMFGLLGTNINATHKHEDDLSFFLWLDGIEWLIDPSFMSHEYKDEVPAYLRSAKAHNMLHVEGATYSFKPQPDRVVLVFDDTANEAQSLTISGRNRSCAGYEIIRDIKCNEINGLPQLTCTDHFNSIVTTKGSDDEGTTAVGVLTFHFGDGVQLALDRKKTQTVLELTHPASSKKLILTIGHEDDSEPWDAKIEESVCGLGFMQHIATQALRVRVPVSAECRWIIDVK